MKSLAAMRHWIDPDDEPTLVVHTLASLELSPIAVVEETTPIAELRALLVELRVPAIAVVDGERSLRGLVTRTDVLRDLDTSAATAGDIMSSFVFALPLDAAIEQAAALMAHEGVGQIVVTTLKGELAGMVSALDIARHVAMRAGYIGN